MSSESIIALTDARIAVGEAFGRVRGASEAHQAVLRASIADGRGIVPQFVYDALQAAQDTADTDYRNQAARAKEWLT